MDPNEALKQAREAVARLKRGNEIDDAIDLAEAFEALDMWLTNGGFLPEAWHACVR